MKRSRLRAVSAKRRQGQADYVAFVLGIKSRDGWRCAFCGTRQGVLDPHHVLKPRAKYLTDPNAVVTLCRRCHRRVEAPYTKGRLVVTPDGHGRFRFDLVYAASKQAARAAGLV